jgi:signal transduction histidine kinase
VSPSRDGQAADRWEALAAGLAHEIKNPLSTINLTLQMLREDVYARDRNSPAELVPRIDLVISEVEHLQQIVQDFLRLARAPQLNVQAEDVNSLIEEVRAFLAPELEERGIDPVIHVDRSIGLAQVDLPLFRQVVNNLLRNALQAMPDGGVLTVQTRREDPYFVLRVIDTGKGIPENLRDRIFDGFFSTRPEGTGIGLTLTRQIVELHGGTVTCQSALGKGTLFEVRIPLGGPAAGVESVS